MIYTTFGSFRAGFYDAATAPGTDADGNEKWPRAKVHVAGFTSITKPTFPIQPVVASCYPIYINATGVRVADAALGVDEYDWYVSQRSDDAALQCLAIEQFPDTIVPSESFSGSINIRRTTLGESLFPSDFPITEEDVIGLFRHVTIYVQRRSDKLIQVMRPLDSLLASL